MYLLKVIFLNPQIENIFEFDKNFVLYVSFVFQ